MRRVCHALALGTLLGCSRPPPTAPLPRPQGPSPHKMAVLVHGYISEAGAFTELSEPLARGGDHGEPLHVHRFDYSRFSRVGYSHNVGVERLGTALGEAVSALKSGCEVCASWSEDPVDVTLIGRSFGGLIVREALLQDVEQHWGGWEVDRVVTLGTPMYGSTLTRYSTGFLSVVINGGIRTVLFGFVNPERGGAFGHVIDAQVRAMRLGSPYQLDAHDRMLDWLGGDYPPPWLVVAAVGARDEVHKGDGVVRFSAANFSPVVPSMGAETLPVVVRHSRLYQSPPTRAETVELDRLRKAIRHFVDHGTVSNLDSLAPFTVSGGVAASHADEAEVWLPREAEERRSVQRRLNRLQQADQGDVWLRFYRGLPGLTGTEPEPLPIAAGVSMLQARPEWSRRWVDLEVEPGEDGATSVVSVGPLGSRHLFLPDVGPSGTWSLRVGLEDGGWVADDKLRIRVNGGPASVGGLLQVRALQNNVVDVFIDEDGAIPPVGALALQPE